MPDLGARLKKFGLALHEDKTQLIEFGRLPALTRARLGLPRPRTFDPLHPAGQPEKLRDAHIAEIRVPVLCLNGTRDALCRRDPMERVVDRLTGQWTMHWLEGADHSFHVLKSSGRSDSDVLNEIADISSAWASGLR